MRYRTFLASVAGLLLLALLAAAPLARSAPPPTRLGPGSASSKGSSAGQGIEGEDLGAFRERAASDEGLDAGTRPHREGRLDHCKGQGWLGRVGVEREV